jgi:uncharacterized sulfatase
MKARTFLVGFLLAQVALVPSVRGVEKPEQLPPNIVLIISDDHGWTDYGFMGHRQIATPHLDRLASQSLVFPRGYVPSSLCCPSLASIITGLYPHQHKITFNDPPQPLGMKPGEFYKSAAFAEGREVMNRHLDRVATLPRLLATKDYWSLQTGKWWLGDYRRGGFTHGMTKGQRHGDAGLDIGRKTMQPIFDFIQEAQAARKPFFVWYAPMLPHQPHNPPERFLEKYRSKTPSLPVARYWAMVEWFDDTCGQLLDDLERKGLANHTLVVYVTDNGWIQDPKGPGPLRSKLTPYDAGLRTPIMIRWPGRVKAGRCEVPVLSLDIAPTLLTAVGLKPTPEMPGVNLLDEATVQRRQVIFGECFTHNALDLHNPSRNLVARWIIANRWKLIVPRDLSAKPGVELYDLLADPHEKSNFAQSKADLVGTLCRQLDNWWTPIVKNIEGPPK